MAVCDMGHEHPDPTPEPVVVEDKSAEDVAETVSDAEVEIARINAQRDVEVEKLYNKGLDQERETELARLRARVEVLEAAMAPPAPEPEIVPVPVPEPEPDPEPGPPAPPETGEPKTAKKSGGGWWDGYSG